MRHYVAKCQKYKAMIAAYRVGARIPFYTSTGIVLDCNTDVFQQWKEVYGHIRKKRIEKKEGKNEHTTGDTTRIA